MDDTLRIFGYVIATIFTLLLGYVVKNISSIGREQQSQKTDIELIKRDLGDVSNKVSTIHEWRNQLQREESEQAKRYIAELESQLKS